MVPLMDNKGKWQPKRFRAFLGAVADRAGGYTQGAAGMGYWRNPDSGKVMLEPVVPVEVITDGVTMMQIKELFKRNFPDQHSIAFADCGEAFLEEL